MPICNKKMRCQCVFEVKTGKKYPWDTIFRVPWICLFFVFLFLFVFGNRVDRDLYVEDTFLC